MILRIGAAGEDLVTIRRAPRPLYCTTLFSRYNSAQYNSGVYVGSPKAAVKRPFRTDRCGGPVHAHAPGRRARRCATCAVPAPTTKINE